MHDDFDSFAYLQWPGFFFFNLFIFIFPCLCAMNCNK